MGQQALLPYQQEMDERVSGLVGQGVALRRIQTPYATAMEVQRSRVQDLDLIHKSVLKEFELAADNAFYAWTVETKKSGLSLISGPSYEGAMIFARNWRNCAIDVDVVGENMAEWTFRAALIDLETGFTAPRLFRQRKSESHGKFDEERAMDIAFQIGQSKAIRNAIVACMPGYWVEEALQVARREDEKRKANVREQIPRFEAAFAQYGVTLQQLERRVVRQIKDWRPCDISMLAAIGRAIKEGQTSVAQEFPGLASLVAPSPSPPPPPPPTPEAAVKQSIENEIQAAVAQPVVSNPEPSQTQIEAAIDAAVQAVGETKAFGPTGVGTIVGTACPQCGLIQYRQPDGGVKCPKLHCYKSEFEGREPKPAVTPPAQQVEQSAVSVERRKRGRPPKVDVAQPTAQVPAAAPTPPADLAHPPFYQEEPSVFQHSGLQSSSMAIQLPAAAGAEPTAVSTTVPSPPPVVDVVLDIAWKQKIEQAQTRDEAIAAAKEAVATIKREEVMAVLNPVLSRIMAKPPEGGAR